MASCATLRDWTQQTGEDKAANPPHFGEQVTSHMLGIGAGSVESLWRYPVKSMAGEELNTTDVTDRGLVGDRHLALIDDSDQKVVSAKNPRKWPQLFEFGAAFTSAPRSKTALPPVRITLPDGTSVSSDQIDVDRTLSEALGRPVRVQAAKPGQEPVVESTFPNPWVATSEAFWPDMEGLTFRNTVTEFNLPEGTFFDSAVVHLVTTATLHRLTELYPGGSMAPRRFRPNLVIDTPDGAAGFVENGWLGQILQVGNEVRLAITEPCSRCVMVTLPQGDLPKDSGILRTAARHNQMHVGVYASVQHGGQVRRGDRISIA